MVKNPYKRRKKAEAQGIRQVPIVSSVSSSPLESGNTNIHSTNTPSTDVWSGEQRKIDSQSESKYPYTTRKTPSCRVILLLDLDCFYAQCECIRLGLDATVTSLALLQWNSCLAVTYPARKHGIKRGDGWDTIAQKDPHCLCVHVPVLSFSSTKTGATNDTAASEEASETVVSSLESEYANIYQLSKEEQIMERKQAIGKRYHSNSGKACIERYRIASAKIFETVLEYTNNVLSSSGTSILLERASIDEFYLDVSNFVAQENDLSDESNLSKSSVVVGSHTQTEQEPPTMETTDEDDVYYQRGALVAAQIRHIIKTTLGFTLSAGIGPNKTLAKLSASYGKPNGQAICFPSSVPYLLQATPLKDCRNLGGKIGTAVASLLPEGSRTLADVQSLSVPELASALGEATAQWVYRLARGVDNEAVLPKNDLAVTKSLTAFKSLPYTSGNKGHPMSTIGPWLQILAHEIVSRVERDAARNHRYPRTCTVQWAPEVSRETRDSDRSAFHRHRSARIPFPSERFSTEEKIRELCRRAPEAIVSKEGPDFHMHRFGLCAVDFQSREESQQAIDTMLKQMAQSSCHSPGLSNSKPNKAHTRPSVQTEDADLALAIRLQAEYDRENRAHEMLDQRKNSKAESSSSKISLFFSKRPRP